MEMILEKKLFLFFLLFVLILVMREWFFAWFKPNQLSKNSENYRRNILKLYPKSIKEIILAITGNPYSKINIWEARFVLSIILLMLLFALSSIFWSSSF